jgi:hypothetical protein
MARWRLTTSAYLNTTEHVEWEYKQINRQTGREDRKRLPVPRFLDIRDPGDWTVKPGAVSIAHGGNLDEVDGIIIVCHEGKGQPGDVEFLGDPTPDMIPLDDEAKVISASFEDRWRYKPESAEIGYNQSIIDRFEVEMATIKQKADVPQQLVIPGLEDLVKQMAVIAVNQAAMMEKMSKQPSRLG